MCPRGQGRPRGLHLWRRPSKIKFAAEILRKNIIKSIFFVKKKQDFSAAKTPHSGRI